MGFDNLKKEIWHIFMLILILLMMAIGASCNPSCPKLKEGMTNVHLVCHTHDDVGWLKTVDEYFYGSRKRVTWVGVQYILDSVISSLLKNPSRKFIYVESAFFFRWWNEQDEKMKNTVKRLVENGQFEFINGGWCMNDEATAHYTSIIDQMTLGLVKLNKTFGEDAFPRVAWQIDPFGHSREQASLFAQMGFDGLFIGRLDYDDKRNRWKSKKMEMIWKGSESLIGDSSWLFTGVLPRTYSPPKGFCFDLLCADDPMMDDPALEDYNKGEMVKKFIEAVEDQQKAYATSNIVMTMGEDFNYVYAESWYKNLDKLIKYVNELQGNGSKVNLVYSTPSCYLDALHAANKTWPTKSDDFFPYASDPHAFWTGYFTSRPTLKWFIRYSNNILQAVKQILSLTGIKKRDGVEKLVNAMAVAQHHDAVTGTARQRVTDDYSKRLFEGISAGSQNYEEALRSVFKTNDVLIGSDPSFHFCFQLNVSSCSYTESRSQFVVSAYNPIGRFRNHYIRVPVTKNIKYTVTDKEGNRIDSQLVPLPDAVERIPGRKSTAKFELVFRATDIPPLGMKQFYVRGKNSLFKKLLPSRGPHYAVSREDFAFTKGNISVVFDGKTKKMKYILAKTISGQKKIQVSQDWLWYVGSTGDNEKSTQRSSGAYIFRPNGTSQSFTDKIKNTAIHDGLIVAEIHQEWSPWVTQVLRIYKDENYLEMEWLVGPISIEDGLGKEIVNRVTLHDMKTNNTFYTDSNGREMIRRVKNFRTTWDLNNTEPISQNYYPVTSRIAISSVNGQGQSALMNDRSQGGTSMRDGEIELMVHRRLLHDDAFGVGEPLNETAFGKGLVARGRHYLIHSVFDTTDCDFSCQHRSLGEKILLQPLLTFSNPPANIRAWINQGPSKFSGLKKPLPSNIHLLTLEPWEEDKLLLRLENFYEKRENHINSTIIIDIMDLLSGWTITDVQELTLAANRLKKNDNRLKWTPKHRAEKENLFSSRAERNSKKNLHEPSKKMSFEFAPMQIRTFLISVKK